MNLRAAQVIFVIASFLLCDPVTVCPSPLDDPTLGGAVFTGPVHGHASAIFVNPAALDLTGRGFHLHFSGNARLSTLWVNRQNYDAESNSFGPGQNVTSTTPSPGGMLAWYFSAGEKGHFGLAAYSAHWQRFPNDEDAFRYYSRGGHLAQGMISASGAYRVSRLSLGVTFSLGYNSVALNFDRDTALERGSAGTSQDCDGSPCGVENPQAAQTIRASTSTANNPTDFFSRKNLAITLGAILRLADATYVSFSWITLPGSFGSIDLGGQATVTPSALQALDTSFSTEAEIAFRSPHTLLVGFRTPAGLGYDVVADARWQGTARHNQLDLRLFGSELAAADGPEWIPRFRGLASSWRASFGMEEIESAKRTRVGARLRVETPSVARSRLNPTQVHGWNATLALGAEMRLTETWAATLGYDLRWFPKVTSAPNTFDPRDRIDCVDSGFDFNACEGVRQGRAIPTAAGTYHRLDNNFVVSLRYDSL